MSTDERHDKIAEAAYFRAERRGFAPGHELEDWLESEAEIDSEHAVRADPQQQSEEPRKQS